MNAITFSLEAQGQHRDVLDAVAVVALALAAHRFGLAAAHQVEDDRDVVRCEIPRYVYVALKESEIRADGTDVEDVAELARRDDVVHLLDWRTVFKGVPDHQD